MESKFASTKSLSLVRTIYSFTRKVMRIVFYIGFSFSQGHKDEDKQIKRGLPRRGDITYIVGSYLDICITLYI